MPAPFNNLNELLQGFRASFSVERTPITSTSGFLDSDEETTQQPQYIVRTSFLPSSLWSSRPLEGSPSYASIQDEGGKDWLTSDDATPNYEVVRKVGEDDEVIPAVQPAPLVALYTPYSDFQIAGTSNGTISSEILALHSSILLSRGSNEDRYAQAVFAVRSEIREITNILETHYINPVGVDRMSLGHYLEALATFVATAEAILQPPSDTVEGIETAITPHPRSQNLLELSPPTGALSRDRLVKAFIHLSLRDILTQTIETAEIYLRSLAGDTRPSVLSLQGHILAQVALTKASLNKRDTPTETLYHQVHGFLQTLGLACLSPNVPQEKLSAVFKQFTALIEHIKRHNQNYGQFALVDTQHHETLFNQVPLSERSSEGSSSYAASSVPVTTSTVGHGQADEEEDFIPEVRHTASDPAARAPEAPLPSLSVQAFVDYVYAAYALHKTAAEYTAHIKLRTRRADTAKTLKETIDGITHSLANNPQGPLSSHASTAFVDLVTQTIAQEWVIVDDRNRPTRIRSELLSGIRKNLDDIFTRSPIIGSPETNQNLQTALFKLFAQTCLSQMRDYRDAKKDATPTPELTRRFEEVNALMYQASVLAQSCDELSAGDSELNADILANLYKQLLLAIEHLKSSLLLRSSSNLANELGRLLTFDASLLRPRLNELRGQEHPIDISATERDNYAHIRRQLDYVANMSETQANPAHVPTLRSSFFGPPAEIRTYPRTKASIKKLFDGLAGRGPLPSKHYLLAINANQAHDCISAEAINYIDTHAIDDVLDSGLPQPRSEGENTIHVTSIEIARRMLAQTNDPTSVATAVQFMHAAAISLEAGLHAASLAKRASHSSAEHATPEPHESLKQLFGPQAQSIQALVNAIVSDDKDRIHTTLNKLSPACQLKMQPFLTPSNTQDPIAMLFTGLLAEKPEAFSSDCSTLYEEELSKVLRGVKASVSEFFPGGFDGPGMRTFQTSENPRTIITYIKELSDTISTAAQATTVSRHISPSASESFPVSSFSSSSHAEPVLSSSSSSSFHLNPSLTVSDDIDSSRGHSPGLTVSSSATNPEPSSPDTRTWAIHERRNLIDTVSTTLGRNSVSTTLGTGPANTDNWFLRALIRLVEACLPTFGGWHLSIRGQTDAASNAQSQDLDDFEVIGAPLGQPRTSASSTPTSLGGPSTPASPGIPGTPPPSSSSSSSSSSSGDDRQTDDDLSQGTPPSAQGGNGSSPSLFSAHDPHAPSDNSGSLGLGTESRTPPRTDDQTVDTMLTTPKKGS